METVSIKVSKHSKYAMDLLAARLASRDGKAKTNDDVIWRLFEQYEPELFKQVQSELGEKVEPKRGRAKESDG